MHSEKGKEKSEMWLKETKQERAQIIIRLNEVAWMNFDRRRNYEFKMGIAIWTALAAFIALSLREDVQVPAQLKEHCCWLLGEIVVLSHAIFLIGAKLARNIDKEIAYFYEDELNKATGVCEPRFQNIQKIKRLKTISRWLGLNGWWSPIGQLGITQVLILVALLVLWTKCLN